MTVLPISYDKTSHIISINSPPPSVDAKDLNLEVSQLNTLYKDLMQTNKQLPPPPTKENHSKQLTQMVQKMHMTATGLMKQAKFEEASKKYSIALGLALARSKFESFQLTLPEIVVCLLGRCDSYTNSHMFNEALQDAEVLCLLGPNVADNHLRRAIANANLGFLQQAKSDIDRGLCFNNKHPLLLKMNVIVGQLLDYYNGDI